LNMGDVEWIWVRHGPVQGLEGRYYGQLDVPAEALDPVRAKKVAAQLPEGAVWVTTPLSRTRVTAYGLKPEVQPIPVAEFSEQNFGEWQGRSYQEVYAAHGDMDWQAPEGVCPPGGESFADMMARVGGGIDRLNAQHEGQSVVAVAHAGTICSALGVALDLTPGKALAFEVAPLSVTRLRYIAPSEASGRAAWVVRQVNSEIW